MLLPLTKMGRAWKMPNGKEFYPQNKAQREIPSGRGTQGLWRIGMSDTDFQVVWVTVL